MGDASFTPGFELNAKYVIHAVGPVWLDGSHDEEKLLRACYQRSLKLEMEQRVLDRLPDAVMLRAEWRYDIRSPKPNYILNILRATDRVAFRSGQYRGVT